MTRLYGSTTKFVRHVDIDKFTVNPQHGYIHTFWKTDDSTATARTDNQELENEKILPLGSKITKHKLEMTVTPYTIEPQNLYMGIVKLSFQDVNSPYVCGWSTNHTSYQSQAAGNAATTYLRLFPKTSSGRYSVDGDETDIDWETASVAISDVMLDDHFKHWVRIKKHTIFDQRPVMTSRFQRIPSKVKRANEHTYYGLWIFNDSPNNADAAKVDFDIKSYYEEWAQ